MAEMTQQEYEHSKKEVYRTTVILAIVTVVEVGFALLYEFKLMESFNLPRWPLMVFVTVASLIKAYWIMNIFMHLGYERKGFILSIVFPFVFLVWAVIAFSYDGSNFHYLKSILNSVF